MLSLYSLLCKFACIFFTLKILLTIFETFHSTSSEKRKKIQSFSDGQFCMKQEIWFWWWRFSIADRASLNHIQPCINWHRICLPLNCPFKFIGFWRTDGSTDQYNSANVQTIDVVVNCNNWNLFVLMFGFVFIWAEKHICRHSSWMEMLIWLWMYFELISSNLKSNRTLNIDVWSPGQNKVYVLRIW